VPVHEAAHRAGAERGIPCHPLWVILGLIGS
jgi:hypothetical protein